MEYAKDMVLDIKNGQGMKNNDEWKISKKKLLKRGLFERISNHKIVVSVVAVTVGFMIIDMILISSFINVLLTFAR